MYSYGPPHMAGQKPDKQLEHTSRIRYVAQKTSPRRWTIGRSGKRLSGISVLAARHDDDDDDDDLSTPDTENCIFDFRFSLVLFYMTSFSILVVIGFPYINKILFYFIFFFLKFLSIMYRQTDKHDKETDWHTWKQKKYLVRLREKDRLST